MKTVCILGGGLGGLMTGALLAKEGYRVTVLEKNAIIGGGLQSFRRGNYIFDTGMHTFGGMGKDGQIRRICRHLGIEERVKTEKLLDIVVDADTGERIIPPLSQETLYLEKMYALTDQETLYRLRPSSEDRIPNISLTAKELLEQTVSDPRQRFLLSYPSLLYGGRDDSPALLHALITCAHMEGTYTFCGGSVAFAKLLVEVIESADGEVHSGEEIISIDTEGREVRAVHTTSATYTADHYVNDMPISRLIDLMPPNAFSPAFRNRIGNAPYTTSALTVFIGLKPRCIKYHGEAYYIMRHDKTQWPDTAFAILAEDPLNPGFAATLTVICPMEYDTVRQWEDSRTGHRPDAYYRWKEQATRQALCFVESQLPTQDVRLLVESGSPLTIRDYYGTPRGALYGIHRSSLDPLQSSLSTRTRLSNLYLTGQDVNFHGLIGTSLTAILTAETITGRNTIVNKLNTDTIWKQ